MKDQSVSTLAIKDMIKNWNGCQNRDRVRAGKDRDYDRSNSKQAEF